MLKNMSPLTIFVALILAIMSCTAIAADTETDFRLEARVMYIDLDNDLINVAETEIELLFHYGEKGVKIWDTQFLDKKGAQISPEQLGMRDKVLVQGRSSEGKISATEIILLEPEKR